MPQNRPCCLHHCGVSTTEEMVCIDYHIHPSICQLRLGHSVVGGGDDNEGHTLIEATEPITELQDLIWGLRVTMNHDPIGPRIDIGLSSAEGILLALFEYQ